jgi:hypothetical protein
MSRNLSAFFSMAIRGAKAAAGRSRLRQWHFVGGPSHSHESLRGSCTRKILVQGGPILGKRTSLAMPNRGVPCVICVICVSVLHINDLRRTQLVTSASSYASASAPGKVFCRAASLPARKTCGFRLAGKISLGFVLSLTSGADGQLSAGRARRDRAPGCDCARS